MNLTIAVPSKGRLKEKAVSLFGDAGFELNLPEDARSYQGSLKTSNGKEIADVLFLSASEIARELANGNIHAGITGEDLARETIANADEHLEFAVKLGFGHANVVIAVPEAWWDVNTMADLDDVAAEFRSRHGRRLRIATKYWNLTQGFFADHGIALYRIVESLGATEAAPAAGQADGIVDITSTGSTLRANGLKILDDGTILQSEANFICSRNAAIKSSHRESLMDICRKLGQGAAQ
ncbi:MAG: ATP phosphoribosyltransferase [Rhizobiaceae bacterium]|nr:ATP phosphoribosyltransferase [Rhizobiaceae bacterium]